MYNRHTFFTTYWSQDGSKLVGTGATNPAYQGQSISISSDGSFALSGGYQDNADAGSVWAFMPTPPSVSTFSPVEGQPGTLISISGTNFSNLEYVTIGGIAATVISNTGSTLVVMEMPGSQTGNIVVATNAGTATNNIAFAVTATPYPFQQQGAKLVGTGASGTSSQQGSAVAISADGNTAIEGGPDDNSQLGAVWIFTRNGTSWTQEGNKLVATGYIGKALQGTSVAISADGNTAIVGAPGDNNNIGAAWIFTRSDTTWTQGPKLIGSGVTGTSAKQGSSVAISADGNTAAIGGSADNSGLGAVWVFTRNGTLWSQLGSKLVGSGAIGAAAQGGSVAVSANGRYNCFWRSFG